MDGSLMDGSRSGGARSEAPGSEGSRLDAPRLDAPRSGAPRSDAPVLARARALLERVFTGRSLEFDLQAPTGIRSLNNSLWLASVRGTTEKYGIRLANASSSEALAIHRSAEYDAWTRAANAGISPQLLAYDRDSGDALMQWIENAPEWTTESFSDANNRARLARTLRVLRSIRIDPPATDTMCPRVRSMALWAAEQGAITRLAQESIAAKVNEVESVYAAVGYQSPHLGHYDLWANNILDEGTRLWIVDWEFAGAGNGLSDLMSYAISADFSAEQEAEFFRDFGATSTAEARRAARLIGQLFEGLWGLNMSVIMATGEHSCAGQEFDYLGHARTQFGLAGVQPAEIVAATAAKKRLSPRACRLDST